MKKNQLIAMAVMLFCSLNTVAQTKTSTIFVNVVFFNQDSIKIDDCEAYFINSKNKTEHPILLMNTLELLPGDYELKIKTNFYKTSDINYFLNQNETINVYLTENVFEHDRYVIRSTSASEKSGFVFTKIKSEELQLKNLAQDFTYLIGNTASAYSTSDAGTGIGYTGIRIRGSDGTRINVNVNGVPINDAESHGVFWVNMPDLASSANSVQIQRGVGSSTNGTGAFGANINISNLMNSQSPFLNINQTIGSFNTSKSTLQFGTGPINHFNFYGRLSKINSDGYIDRAASDLSSFQINLSANYNKYHLNFVTFGGKEKTFQSWYGTPESRVNGDIEGMKQYADRNYLTANQTNNLLQSGRTYNFYTYPNQTDNYWQNHYQMHQNLMINKYLSIKNTSFLTTGKGFYEEFRESASFSSYGVNDLVIVNDTISNTDLVRQRWLDNVFYGNFTNLSYKKNRLEIDLGIMFSKYDGVHFGDVIWANFAQPFGKDFRYYNSSSQKTEQNIFGKLLYQVNKKLSLGTEIQTRWIQYESKGKDNDLQIININERFLFFNPKVNAVYQFNKSNRFFANYSIGNREPVRGDFIDNQNGKTPEHEQLYNLEFGFIQKRKHHFFQINCYDMTYINQLILTGELNDVGSSLRRNVKNSYRRGIELLGKWRINRQFEIEGNASFSMNRIKDFNDFYFDYDSSILIERNYKNTSIAFSPSSIYYISFNTKPNKSIDANLSFKRVGQQFLDNTSNKNVALPSYFTVDCIISKTFKIKNIKTFTLKAQGINLFNQAFSNNGYTFKYGSGGKIVQENFFYPQALRHFFLSVEIEI